MRTSRALAVLIALCAAAPAVAGGYVTLKCDGFEQRFMVGAGRQIRGQGLELWPMLCTDTGRFATYARVGNAERFARLEGLARRPVKDKVEVRSVLDLSAELGDTDLESLFDRVEGLTFGDIRSTVANAARPTPERIGLSDHHLWSHPTCKGGLVPLDFYLDTGAPCPACGGQPLTVDTSDRTEWE